MRKIEPGANGTRGHRERQESSFGQLEAKAPALA
jgi:hypothetical protein